MRFENWNPNAMDQSFENVAISRIVQGAEVVANAARRRCPVGTISRPMYQTGPYAGQPYTARDAGQLKKSIRVTQKKSKTGRPLKTKRNVRIYIGNYLAYYASIVEHSRPFLRPSFNGSLATLKSIIGAR